MLKKIPREELSISFTVHKIGDTAKYFKRKAVSKAKEVRSKILKELKTKDEQLVAKTTVRLGSFIEKGKNWSHREIEELINHLQRLILALRRQQHALMEKASHKMIFKPLRKNTKRTSKASPRSTSKPAAKTTTRSSASKPARKSAKTAPKKSNRRK